VLLFVCRNNGSRSSHIKQANLQLNQPLLGYLQNGRGDEGPWQIRHTLRHLGHPENSTIKIKPYARKWEQTVLELVREITVRSIPPLAAGDTSSITAPPCSVRHDVPAVVFSTGGYNRNFYHVLTDQIIPLYLTAREYNGHVQLLAADYEPKWIAKYRAFLGALSVYPVVDLDADDAVRCFAPRPGTSGWRATGSSASFRASLATAIP
jgi:hypothetical protein